MAEAPAAQQAAGGRQFPGRDREEADGTHDVNRDDVRTDTPSRHGEDRPTTTYVHERFSDWLKTKEYDEGLAEECRRLGPLLGGGQGKRGARGRQTLDSIVRGIASGDVRRHCEEREDKLLELGRTVQEDKEQLAEECRRLGLLLGGPDEADGGGRLPIDSILQGIASGDVRRQCEERERMLLESEWILLESEGELLEREEHDAGLAQECRRLGPLLGELEECGARGRRPFDAIVRGIASGNVRRHCEEREQKLLDLERTMQEEDEQLAEECRLLGPLLGGRGGLGERSLQTLNGIKRGIASGNVRRYCEEREEKLLALEQLQLEAQEADGLERLTQQQCCDGAHGIVLQLEQLSIAEKAQQGQAASLQTGTSGRRGGSPSFIGGPCTNYGLPDPLFMAGFDSPAAYYAYHANKGSVWDPRSAGQMAKRPEF